MAKLKVFSAEQIIMKLREAEVLLGQGKSVKEASRVLEISEQTYYRWRIPHSGHLGIWGTEHNPGKKAKRTGKGKCTSETSGGRSVPRQCNLEGGALKKVISPDRRRQAVEHVQSVMDVSERRVCRVLGQPRSTQRYKRRVADDEDILTALIAALASEYGRYGYRRITAMLHQEGWLVNHKRVERIWRKEGLKLPEKQPKRGRLWLTDGSIVRLRAEFPKHVWSYDFMEDRTHNGVKFRILNIIDEFTRECLAVQVGRSLTHQTVIEVLTELFCEHGVPVHIRSDNGSEFTAKRVRAWLKRLDVKPLFIEPGSPWENGYIESFNGKMRDELLAREIFYSLKEAQVLIEMWRRQYNTVRPHSALGYRPPAPAAIYVQSQSVGLTL